MQHPENVKNDPVLQPLSLAEYRARKKELQTELKLIERKIYAIEKERFKIQFKLDQLAEQWWLEKSLPRRLRTKGA